jgi:hypothetical protein
MNSVNMPGFTAEATLYRTKGRYQTTGPSSTKGNGAIQPAFCACLISCSIHFGCRKICHCRPDPIAIDLGFIPDPGPMDVTNIDLSEVSNAGVFAIS